MALSNLSLRNPDSDYRSGWAELLFDLAFVVALGATTHTLVGKPMPDGLLQFLVTFLLLTWSWSTFTFFVSVFEGAEEWHFTALMQMAVVLVLATFQDLYGSDFETFVVGYTVLRLMGVVMYLRAWLAVSEARRFSSVQIVGTLFALAPMWFGLLASDPEFRELALLLTALIQVLVAPTAFWLDDNVSFNGTHVPERAGILITLSLGECFIAISRVGELVDHVTLNMMGHGFAAVMIVFSLWRLYFGMLASMRFSGRKIGSVLWMLLHIPLVACILALATGVERNLLFIREHQAVASDRLLVAWGGALITIVILGLFWRTDFVSFRSIIWRCLALLMGAVAIATPFSPMTLHPLAALYLLVVASLLVMLINPSTKPWGLSVFPGNNRI